MKWLRVVCPVCGTASSGASDVSEKARLAEWYALHFDFKHKPYPILEQAETNWQS